MLHLASQSPRRIEILTSFNIPFRVISHKVTDEMGTWDSSKPIPINVQTIAEEKARSVSLNETNWVLGCDTTVYIGTTVLGKPKNLSVAKNYLNQLSGKTHYVCSGYALWNRKNMISGYDITQMTFNTISQEQIERYLQESSVLDKAGAYGIQDTPASFIKEVNGSYNNVKGLPIEHIYPLLKKHGII